MKTGGQQRNLKEPIACSSSARDFRVAHADLAGFLENSVDAALAVNDEGRIVFVNTSAIRIFGYSKVELLDQRIDKLIPEQLRSRHSEHLSGFFGASHPRQMGKGRELVALHKDGTQISVEITLSPLEAKGKGLVMCAVRDISERDRVQRRIAVSEARLHDAQRIAKIGNWEWDLATNEEWWSKEVYRILGEDPESHAPSYAHFLERVHPDDRPVLRASVERALAGESTHLVSLRIVLPDGAKKYVDSQGEVIFDEEGRPVRMVGTLQDVTERKQAEDALRLSEARLNEAQRLAKIGNWEFDVVNKDNWWSEELYSILEEDRHNANPSFDDFLRKVHPDDQQGMTDAIRDMSPGPGARFSRDLRLLMPDNRLKYAHMQLEVAFDDQGRHQSGFGTLHDITERKRAEEIATRFGRMLEASLNEIYVFDAETLRFVQVNQGARQNLGYSMDELRGLTALDIEPEMTTDALNRITASLASAGEEMTTFITVHRRKDGSRYPVEVRLQYVPQATSSPVLVAMVQDITERTRADAALRESEGKYRTIVDTAHEGIVVVDNENMITYVNRRMAEMLGYTTDEMLGRSNYDFMDDEGRQVVRSKVKARRAGVTGQYDFRFIHKDGSEVWTSIAATPMGSTASSDAGALLMISDITESRRLEAELRHSQKMDAVGQLTGGIAHDFNNLLTIIIGNLQLLEESAEQRATPNVRAQAALDAALRAAELTSRLLAFSRKQLLVPKVMDINRLVVDLESLLQRTLGEGIIVEAKLTGDLWSTEIDPSQLENALMNLAINARDAMPRGGKLTIETTNTFVDEINASRHPEVSAGEFVLLTVSDNGTGIPKHLLGKVFEPFFSTKEVGKGTGLGLSMVYGFVKQSKGHITIYSEEGHGTTFRLYLPRSLSTAEDTGTSTTRTIQIPTGNETILVVEDDAQVREIAVSHLRGIGYRILEAQSGPEALAILNEHETVDLLLTDMLMPGGMTGAQLAQRARQRAPTLRVLYASGYTATAVFANGLLPQGEEMLTKPYRLNELAHKVRAILDQK